MHVLASQAMVATQAHMGTGNSPRGNSPFMTTFWHLLPLLRIEGILRSHHPISSRRTTCHFF